MRLCFVCSGNICRSPTAEVVMQRLLEDAGLAGRVTVDSAGTGSWHVGEQADARTRQAAKRRGLRITHRARQLTPADLGAFDLLLAIDAGHLAHLQAMKARHGGRAELALLRSFDPSGPSGPGGPGGKGDLDVPDPYYGDREGFEHVLDLCEIACRGLLAHVQQTLGAR